MPERVSTRIAGIGRATSARVAGSRPARAQRRDRCGRREDAAGTPVPDGRPFQDDDLATRCGESGGQDRPGRTPTDDRDPDPLGGIGAALSLNAPRQKKAEIRRRLACPDVAGRRNRGDGVALAEGAALRPDGRQVGGPQEVLHSLIGPDTSEGQRVVRPVVRPGSRSGDDR